MTKELLEQQYFSIKENRIKNRYISLDHILPLLEELKLKTSVEVLGYSVENRPIHMIKIGNGAKKIFMWSQMHGNESTTTKSVFDVCHALFLDSYKYLLETCTIAIIPMLNPDGSHRYTRVNANEVDLNRDAQDLTQPESKLLRSFYKDFKPDYCFNLHGQRTIFSAGTSGKPATVSFLSPSQDMERTITPTRMVAMEVIVKMNEALQEIIPDQVGIYDDSFNINCVGDMFQGLGTPTILFEAGHFCEDYSREQTRFFIFYALMAALDYISKTNVTGNFHQSYFSIPNNEKNFYDIIIRNVNNCSNKDVAIQYQEKLEGKIVKFLPRIEEISDLSKFYAHKVINANNDKVLTSNGDDPKVGFEIDFVRINSKEFSLLLT